MERHSLTVQTEGNTTEEEGSGCRPRLRAQSVLGCRYLRSVRHDPLGHPHRLRGGSGTRRLGLGRDANFDVRTAANFGGAAAFLTER